MNIASFFCPFSNKFHSTTDFNQLTGWEKFKTITLTALAALASLPLFGLGGVAVFRAMVGHYTKINLEALSGEEHEAVASKVHDVANLVFDNTLRREMETQFEARGIEKEVIDDVDSSNSEEHHADESKSLDHYSQEEVQAYISLIRFNYTEEGKADVIEGAHKSFMEQFEAAKSVAVDLHRTFREKFDKLPVTSKHGTTTATLTQFKVAQRLLRTNFPGLSSLAFNLEQKCAVAQLMQIIMCGQNACDYSLPKTPNYFLIQELKGKTSLAQEEIKEDYLAGCLEILQAKKEGEGADEHYKRNFLHAMHLFANDCLNRTLNHFYIDEKQYIKLGRENQDPARVVEFIRDQLVSELTSHPDKVKQLVQEGKEQRSIVSWMKHWFATEEDGEGLLPESVLVAALSDEMAVYSQDQVVSAALAKVVENCRLDETVVQDLVEKSGCDANDIKSIVRIRVVQMMIVMHQGFQRDSLMGLMPHLQSYGEGAVLHAKTRSSLFQAPKNVLLEDLSTILVNEIVVTEPDFQNEGIVEYFERDTVVLAKVITKDKVQHFTSGKTNRTIVGLFDVQFSWQITDGILDHLVQQIDPDALASQPEEKYSQLKADLEADLSVLDEISKIQPQAPSTASIWSWFSTPAVPEELQNVQRISGAIGQVSDHCQEYLRILSILDQQNDGDMKLLKGLSAHLVNASGSIASLKDHYEQNNGDEQAQVLEQILDSINILVGQLPAESKVETSKSYWQRLVGAFGQSQDAIDLEWKVQKYETQVLELRRLFEITFLECAQTIDLEGSWVMACLDSDVVTRLYAILSSLDIDTEDVQRYSQDNLAKVRNVINEEFIPAFRKEFDENPNNPYLLKVADLLFTKVSLQERCFATLDTFNQMGAITLGQQVGEVDETAHGEHPFVKWINTVYKRLGAVPYSAKAPILNQWANSARGQWNRNFDPYRQGNPTHHFWNLQIGDRVVKMLGMGTPTHEDGSSVAHLNQEFVALMKHYKAESKRHLYVNNQNLIPKTGWVASIINGDETARSDLILDLQDKEEVKGAYFAIALSKNSQFYSQKGKWAESSEAKSFKNSLFFQVCQGPRHITGSYIPEIIRELIPNFDGLSKGMIDQIHEKVFKGREELTLEERRWFIELFYDNLVKMILVEGKFDSQNGSCKDQIDRGAGTNAQLAANCYVVEQEDGVLTEEQQNHVLMLMMVRALLVRKRPPLHERVERFAEGMEMTFKHVPELKALHQELFQGLQMIPATV